MRTSASVLLCLLTTTLLGCPKDPPKPAPAADDAAAATAPVTVDTKHLDAAAAKALAEIATLETTKDVTCWTSFRQLDSFISSKEYSTFATLAKITAVKALVRAAWEKAGRDGKGPEITAQDLKNLKVEGTSLPEKQREDLASFATDKGMKAYKDYRTTSEHWRVLLSVMQDEIVAGGKTTLRPLAADALPELAELATRVSLILLQRSGQLAATERTPFIEGSHVKRAHGELATQLGLTNSPRTGQPLADAEVVPRLGPLTKTLIEGKVKALLTFNKSSGDPVADLNRVARTKVTADGLEVIKKELQSFAHFVAAGYEPMQSDNYLSDGQFAEAKLPRKAYIDAAHAENATLQLFPHLIMPNGDVKVHFEPNPASPSKKARKAYDLLMLDFEQNAVRDTALHWQMMDTVYKEKAFAMDPFASEYLSEVLSMWITLYLRRGEMVAKDLGKKEIDAEVAKKIRDTDYVATLPHPANEQTPWTPEQQKKKDAALAKYKGNLFKDVTKDSGLPFTAPKLPPVDPANMDHGIQQVMGAGIGVGDVDKNGYPDLFVAGEGFGRLYLNKGKAAPGKFTDATEAWGIPAGLDDSKHPIFFDMEGDGDLDLLIVRSEHPSLLLKQEGGKFVDVTEATGLRTAPGGAHVATVFDYDGDGDLDVYVGYYGADANNRGGSKKRNLPSMDGKNGTPHQLFRRGPDGKYVDVAKEAGVADVGWTLAIGAFDYDNDLDMDLFLANDFGADVFYKNKGDGTFEDISKVTQTDDRGSGMNASFVDANKDGWMDLYVSNIDMFSKNIKVIYPTDQTTLPTLDEALQRTFQYLSGNKLYVNPGDKNGRAAFKPEEGLRFEPGDRGWGWSATFFDYDNDADDDMYLSNGWIDGSFAANQKNQMFVNDGGFFFLANEKSPEAFAGNSRGVVALDMDRDGDLDLVVNNFRQPLMMLENTQKAGNNWVGLRLRGGGANSGGIGASIAISTRGPNKTTVVRQVTCGSMYLGQDEDVITVGIGTSPEADIAVRWPILNGSPTKPTITLVAAGNIADVRRPDPKPAPRP